MSNLYFSGQLWKDAIPQINFLKLYTLLKKRTGNERYFFCQDSLMMLLKIISKTRQWGHK